MARSPELEAEIKKIKEDKLFIPDKEAEALARERLANRNIPTTAPDTLNTTEGANVASLSPAFNALRTGQLVSVTPSYQEELDKKSKQDSTQVSAATDTGEANKEDKKTPGAFDPNSIVGAMNSLAQTMSGVPADVKKQFDPALNKINESLAEFNSMYQADQKEAKDANEKAKNRAEWASIASMLAKNVVGYAAALNGVDPNAMAYQTTDWNKRIQDLNSELDMNLGHLRENMKMKVEAKLGEKKDILGQMDDTFKAKMDALRAKMEGTKAGFSAQLQQSEAEKDRAAREELAKTKADGSTTVKTEDIAPKVQQALGKAADKKTMNAGVAELKGIAVQLGKDPNQIDALVKKYQGTFDLGAPNEVAPQAQSEIAQYLSGMLTKTTTTGKTAQGAGQVGAPVVQSEGMVTVTDIASGKSKQYPANHPAVAKAKGNPNFKVE